MEINDGVDGTVRDMDIQGGELKVYDNFLSKELADFYFETFLYSTPFVQGRVKNGSEHRLTCFYSELFNTDGTLRNYQYSGKENPPLPFTDELSMLKADIEKVTGQRYNCCLINLYRDGKDKIGFHGDSETSLIKYSTIASVSLGAERWFDVRANPNAPNPNYEQSFRTIHGSMITMGGMMQTYYKHAIRQEAKVKGPRINLTFRLAK